MHTITSARGLSRFTFSPDHNMRGGAPIRNSTTEVLAQYGQLTDLLDSLLPQIKKAYCNGHFTDHLYKGDDNTILILPIPGLPTPRRAFTALTKDTLYLAWLPNDKNKDLVKLAQNVVVNEKPSYEAFKKLVFALAKAKYPLANITTT